MHKLLFLTHFSITGNACLTLFVLIFQKANSKASWITILQTNIQIYDRSKLKILSKCYGKTADKVTWPMEIDSPWIILPRCCHVPAMSPSRHSYIFVGWKSNQGEEEEVPSPKNSSFFIISSCSRFPLTFVIRIQVRIDSSHWVLNITGATNF